MTVALGGSGATVGGTPSAETLTASGAIQATATVEQHPVGIGVVQPPALPGGRIPGTGATFDRARGHQEVLSRLIDLALNAEHRRASFTVANQAEAINLLVAITESGKERPFEREAHEVYPLDNWAFVHEYMVYLVTACLSEDDAISKGMAEQYGDQILDVVEYLSEYTHSNLGTNPENGSFALDEHGVDQYAESAPSIRGVLFRGPAGIVRALRGNPDAQGSGTLSRAWDLCREFIERETGLMPTREFGFHVMDLYDWDPEWMRSMAGHVFPTAAADRKRFLAAVGTFLEENPTETMFFDPVFHDLYRRAMALTEKDACLWSDPTFSIGRIFAHAHFRFEGFGPDHPLFREFRERCTHRQVLGFVEHTNGLFRVGFPVLRGFSGPRAIASWEWLLDHPDPEVLPMIGDWMSMNSGVYTPDELADLTLRTMRLTDGHLRSDSELHESIEELAGMVPDKVLRILELYFRPEHMGAQSDRTFLYMFRPERWDNAVGTLSENPGTREGGNRLREFLEEVRREYWRWRDRENAKLAEEAEAQ